MTPQVNRLFAILEKATERKDAGRGQAQGAVRRRTARIERQPPRGAVHVHQNPEAESHVGVRTGHGH